MLYGQQRPEETPAFFYIQTKAASAYSTMRAAGPAAGAAHPAPELGERLLDTDAAGLGLLAGDNPADPLVARERRDVLPRRSRSWSCGQSLSQICGEGV